MQHDIHQDQGEAKRENANVNGDQRATGANELQNGLQPGDARGSRSAPLNECTRLTLDPACSGVERATAKTELVARCGTSIRKPFDRKFSRAK